MLHDMMNLLLRTNLSASSAAVLLLPLKWLLQRLGCPKRMTFLLWGVIALRLLCPILPQIEITLSAAPLQKSTATVPDTAADCKAAAAQTSAEPTIAQSTQGTALEVLRRSVPVVWLTGVLVMAAVGLAAYGRLKRRLRFAVRYQPHDNVFMQEGLMGSFVFGCWRPVVYIPTQADEAQLSYMLLHEKMHIRRRDHLFKLLAYALLCLHWMNPLNWLLFKLFTDDMELCCDEAVLSELRQEERADYAKALFCGMLQNLRQPQTFLQTGFADGIMKRRIRSALQYRGRSYACMGISLCICLLLAVLFATNITAAAQPNKQPELMPVAEQQLPQSATVEPKTEHEAEPLMIAPEEVDASAEVISQPSENLASEPQTQDALPPIQVRTGPYNTQNGDTVRERQILCGSGGISVLLNMNTQSLMCVTLYDAALGQEVLSDYVLADGEPYVFCDLLPNRAYDVNIRAATGTDWQLEGTYEIQTLNTERKDETE